MFGLAIPTGEGVHVRGLDHRLAVPKVARQYQR